MKSSKLNIAILMTTFNGEKYIQKQLDSILNQKKIKFKLFISDDRSTDDTKDIITKYKNKFRNIIEIVKLKTHRNPSKNFLQLIKFVGKKYNYYAFSDQDDIWDLNKLHIAINRINSCSVNLYCSRSNYIDESGKNLGFSKNFKKKPSIRNSLIQSIAGGNTMVWTKKLQSVICNLNIHSSPAHDWTLYQIATYMNFGVFYDSISRIKYRQHEFNFVGENLSLRARIIRIKLGLSGKFKKAQDCNEKILIKLIKMYPNNNLDIVKSFMLSRKSNFFLFRLYFHFKSGVTRQKSIDNIFYLIAVLLNKH